MFDGFKYLGIILVTAIPFGIYDLVEALDNVESAAAAGDSFPTTRVLTADGVISLIGCLMGNPFINAVYIGHPGWKAMGGRIGYSAVTGIIVLVLTWFGIIARDDGADPGRRDPADPALHRHADRLAGVPGIAAPRMHRRSCWRCCRSSPPGARRRSTTRLAPPAPAPRAVGIDKLAQVGVLYHGLETLGGGATLAGIILGAITVFIIDREFEKAAAFALAGHDPDVLRLHPWRGDRHRQFPGGGGRLSRRGR